jgi:hypothetical protein
MHLYRQSIIIFGLILPVLIALALTGLGFLAKSKVSASFANKESQSKSHRMVVIGATQAEAQVSLDRVHLERWNMLLSEDTASAVAANLRVIVESLPDDEIQQTAFERANESGGFGAAAAQKSTQIRMAYRGTYRTLQRAFLELETRMPQLQLQEIRLNTTGSQSSQLNLQATYTAWEN